MTDSPIENSEDCSWLTKRWAVAHRLNSEHHWFTLASHLHCCSMAVWDFDRVQRMEYIALAALADAHAMNVSHNKAQYQGSTPTEWDGVIPDEWLNYPGEWDANKMLAYWKGTFDLDKWLDYLDDLHESGDVNMFAAAPYLMDEYGMQPKDARKMLVYWMETFEARHKGRST